MKTVFTLNLISSFPLFAIAQKAPKRLAKNILPPTGPRWPGFLAAHPPLGVKDIIDKGVEPSGTLGQKENSGG